MNINGREERFCGTLVTVSADNLASQQVGGYKSLASATRKCRFCMAVSDDMSTKVLCPMYSYISYIEVHIYFTVY